MREFKTTTELLPYQIEAVTKLLPTRVGALFAEMGTGKTRMAIEFVKIRHAKIDRVLWFMPVSLKETVRREIFKHTDCADSDVYVFSQKTNERNVSQSAMWYVIGLESISQSVKTALTVKSIVTDDTFVIVDESTYIKGNRSLRAQRLISFCESCRYRMILTGTPMTQGIPDLYSQMFFLSPKILGYRSWYSFAANHLEYHKHRKGMIVAAHNVDYLAEKMKPYVYQITKKECLDLPDKLYHSHWVSLTSEQREAYEFAKQDFLDNAIPDDNGDIDSISFFHLFTSLQSIVCGFWNYDENWAERDLPRIEKHETYAHNRLDGLLDAIELLQNGDKVIIWAKFRYCVEQIRDALRNKYGDDSVAIFYGNIPPKQREEEITKFRNSARFFVATQSAGGHGLTLNEAHNVIFYADGFKYSERLQAEDRCHRIGQTMPVTYVAIQSDANIENRIQSSLLKKSNILSDFRDEINKVKDSNKKDKIRELVMGL